MSIELGNIEVSKTSIEMKVKLFDITGLTITESGKLLYKSRRIKITRCKPWHLLKVADAVYDTVIFGVALK